MDYDQKLISACLRFARRHRGLTGTNPSVGTLLVKFEDGHLRMVGRGVTAIGGRPHAERVAIDMAGAEAEGATAYVTLEPCAHHASTPPCAQALIDAGVKRVVTAWIDPDVRVDGKGHGMLRSAGVEVETEINSDVASRDLSAYLSRKSRGRPHVVLKLAVSADGWLGIRGQEAIITGELARNYGQRMRAESDAILVGMGTVDADDPSLTCRLPGLADRSPRRYVLDPTARMRADRLLATTARDVPTHIVTARDHLPDDLAKSGVVRLPAELVDGELAIAEVLEDMAATGVSSLMVEGGAKVAESFLAAGLVDEIALFTSRNSLESGDIRSPLTPDTIPEGFALHRELSLGEDRLFQYFKD